MTQEEINAYVLRLESASLEETENILREINYRDTFALSRICDFLAEEINILRNLNNENVDDVLSDEILDLLKKYYICTRLFDSQNNAEYRNAYKVVFLKTSAGKPYFKADLDKIPRELYGKVEKVLNNIINGVNMGDFTKVKFFAQAIFPVKIIEFKGFQVRIFTTKIRDDVLCIVGLELKKEYHSRRIDGRLRKRLYDCKDQVEQLRNDINDVSKKDELLLEGQVVLDEIMNVLSQENNDEVELLFPSDDVLESLVPYEGEKREFEKRKIFNNDFGDDKEESNVFEKVENGSVILEEVLPSTAKVNEVIPDTCKKVKRRGRGLGKKTIVKNEIIGLLKGLNLEELLEIQNFVSKIREDKNLNESIVNMHDGFLNMSDDQVRKFENSIKYFKYDDLGKSK